LSRRADCVRLDGAARDRRLLFDMEGLLLALPLVALSSEDVLHDPEKVLGIPMIAVGVLGLLLFLIWLARARNE
jgi:hypothetical protein